jgi:hypothetical protein
MARLSELWTGRLPLSVAFWTYAVFWGFLLNLAATLGSLAVLAASSGGAPETSMALLSAALHVAPLPYNLAVLVGVWRSAGRPEVSPQLRLLARTVILGWTGGMTIF